MKQHQTTWFSNKKNVLHTYYNIFSSTRKFYRNCFHIPVCCKSLEIFLYIWAYSCIFSIWNNLRNTVKLFRKLITWLFLKTEKILTLYFPRLLSVHLAQMFSPSPISPGFPIQSFSESPALLFLSAPGMYRQAKNHKLNVITITAAISSLTESDFFISVIVSTAHVS